MPEGLQSKTPVDGAEAQASQLSKDSFMGKAAGCWNAATRYLTQLGVEKHPIATNPSFSNALDTCNQSQIWVRKHFFN